MTECIIDGRPMPDQAYACQHCADWARGQLDTVADMASAARDVAQGQARRGSSGATSGEARLPFNLGATQRLDEVENRLSTWCRHVAETRGVELPDLAMGAARA